MKARLVLLCLLLAGCGGQSGSGSTDAAPSPAPPSASASAPASPAAAASTSPSPLPTNSPVPPAAAGVHFETPEAAMRYLATAWNRMDIPSLKHVTDPAARDLLIDMYREATDLQLDHCTFTKARGDYECFFTHGYPEGYKTAKKIGTAEFTVGPADRPGWYMTYFVDCG
jgi:hypothetical protein